MLWYFISQTTLVSPDDLLSRVSYMYRVISTYVRVSACVFTDCAGTHTWWT